MDKIREPLLTYEYLTPDLAKEYGISKSKFYNYVKKNNLEQVSHGIYLDKNEWIDDLYILHLRCPQAVFSHEEALYYHNLIDREPLIHTLTIYSGYNPHRLKKGGNCKVFTVKKELLDIGKIYVKDNFDNEIPMYDLERTMCDLVRSRSNVEMQDFVTAFQTYVQRKDKNLSRLIEYAEMFKVQNIIRKYMEVLL